MTVRTEYPIIAVYKCKSRKEAYRVLHLLDMIDKTPKEWEIIYYKGRAQSIHLTY